MTAVAAEAIFFTLAELYGAEGREVLRILRNLDQIFRLCTLGNLDLAVLPDAWNVGLPGFTHTANKAVRAAQQQHVRLQGIAARQDAQVLKHDGVEQRCHQLIGRRPDLLQTVDVGFREDAALPGYFVQLDPVVSLFTKLFGRNLELGVDLVYHRARAAGALVIHGRNFLLAPGPLIILEHDDLRVLAA